MLYFFFEFDVKKKDITLKRKRKSEYLVDQHLCGDVSSLSMKTFQNFNIRENRMGSISSFPTVFRNFLKNLKLS